MRRLALALCVLVLACLAAAVAFAGDPASDEIQVNELVTDGQQDDAQVAMDGDGDFMVAWQSDEPGAGGPDDVYIRRFAADGTPEFDDTVLNAATVEDQDDPAIASAPDGTGIVAFHTDVAGQEDILAHLFDTNGPVGADIDVGVAGGDDRNPAVAVDANGNSIVAWEGLDALGTRGIFALRFDAAGAPIDLQEIEVAVTGLEEGRPAVAVDDDGDFVVAWERCCTVGQLGDIYARRYTEEGVPVANEFAVQATSDSHDHSAVAMDADGDFVVAWDGPNSAGEGEDISFQRYDAAASPQGGVTLANTTTTGNQVEPAVTLDDDGDFALSWHGVGDSDPDGVFYRDFAADGTPRDDEALANETTADEQQVSSISSDADGDLVVSWEVNFATPDTEDVFVRLFTPGGSAGPSRPVFTDIDPDSPANANAPRIKGTADAGTTVTLYKNATCTTTPAATGTAAEFASPGLQVNVQNDTSTTFYATATDPSTGPSLCSTSSITYVEDSKAPPRPTVTDTDPDSPADDNSPLVKGAAEAGSTVRLYTDAACTSPVAATGSALAFASPGLPVSVGDNTTTTFYARATDQAGNVSTCAETSVTYVESSAPPDATPPPAAIVSAPSGKVSDRSPTFTFTANEAGVTFECSLDGGAFAACTSPFTAPLLGGGPHTFAVRARDASGNLGPATTVAFSVTQTLDELTAADPPTFAQDVNVAPVGDGPVLVGTRTGTARARAGASQNGLKGVTFVPLEEARQIAVGSFLDTSKGTVELLSARNSAGATQSGRFRSGIFQVLQARNQRGLTELRLKGSSFRSCRRRASGSGVWWHEAAEAALARLSRRTIRRLRSNATGRFRTRGRHSAATVRGTVWETIDRCDGTLTDVTRGRVVVRDFRRRKNVTVRAGKRTPGRGGGPGSYLARAR
jgi:hypothetical protein